MSGFDKWIAAEVSVKTRKIALDILNGVVDGTAVKTGRARGNWGVSTAKPPETATDATDEGGGATKEAGAIAIDGSPPFSTVYIYNNLPYINKLNQGHSKKKPAGFIESSIDRALRSVKK